MLLSQIPSKTDRFQMKKILLSISIFLVVSLVATAQVSKPPVYSGCENVALEELNNCFNSKLKAAILNEFKVPAIVEKESYKGKINVVFIVSKEGVFEILYVKSMYPELEEEVKRVFQTLPVITGPTYNGRAIDERYQIPIRIPLSDNYQTQVVVDDKNDIQEEILDNKNTLFPEFQS